MARNQKKVVYRPIRRTPAQIAAEKAEAAVPKVLPPLKLPDWASNPMVLGGSKSSAEEKARDASERQHAPTPGTHTARLVENIG